MQSVEEVRTDTGLQLSVSECAGANQCRNKQIAGPVHCAQTKKSSEFRRKSLSLEPEPQNLNPNFSP